MKKTLLMLNASMHDVPLILAARNLGFYVITTSNKPDYPGHRYADEYICCDYNDHESLVKLCREHHVTAVSCGTSDGASYPAAYLDAYFGWGGHDSPETIRTLHDKGQFKMFCKKHGVQAPVSELYEQEEAALAAENAWNYPVIVKPVDLAGGQGIGVVREPGEYKAAIRSAFERSRVKHVVVEPFVVGSQHSFSSFLVKGKVVSHCTWNDLEYPGKYMISKGSVPAVYGPGVCAEHVEQVLVGEVEKIAKLLNLVDGLFHLQYIVAENGEPYIIEVMRRSPGNWTTSLATLGTGINWNEWIILAESGSDCSGVPKDRKQSGFWGYYMILSECNGVLDEVEIAPEIRGNILRIDAWEERGHEITDFQHDKLGLVHMWFAKEEEMKEKMCRIDELIHAKVFP